MSVSVDQLRAAGRVDDLDTQTLLARFATVHGTRRPLYLTADEFDAILRWKLKTQYGRQRARREVNTPEVIEAITGAALAISHPDFDYEVELRIGILCVLRGVAVPVASAILALVFPEDYGVIDFRNWSQVFDEEGSNFSIADYRRYLGVLRPLARNLGWTVQEVDLAIWNIDDNK